MPTKQRCLVSHVLIFSNERRSTRNHPHARPGAAYRGADISPQFRVRSFKIQDIALHPVEIAYSPQPTASDDHSGTSGEVARQTIYAADALLGSKRKVTFKKRVDFTVNVSQSISSAGETSASAAAAAFTVKVSGVADALAKHSSELVEGTSPKVKLYMTLTTSGTIQFDRAAIDIETKPPGGDSIKGRGCCYE